MSEAVAAISAILAAIIGLAIVAVLVSQNAQTATVIQGAGQAFGGIIGAAVQPVTNSSNNMFGVVH